MWGGGSFPPLPTISEKLTGNIAKSRLLVNPYGPEIRTEFCYLLVFSRGK